MLSKVNIFIILTNVKKEIRNGLKLNLSKCSFKYNSEFIYYVQIIYKFNQNFPNFI